MGTQNIASLKLSGTAKKAAEELLKAHPEVTFTSGRRDMKEQADAMASNVIKNRVWIKQTYAASKASKECQKWVDDNPDAKTRAEIAAGLLKTLNGLGTAAGQISSHLTGNAFDVQPVSKDAAAIKATIRKLKGLRKFLEKEGGLIRWHAEF